jgi:DNA replication protein DnaC
MITETIIDGLKKLKLPGMLEALQQFVQQPESSNLSFEERLEILIDRELLSKDNKKYKRLINSAKLRISQASTEAIDFSQQRNLDKAQIASLVTCDWMRKQHNIIFTGATGVGKSYLACALGRQACRQGFVVKYFRVPRLFEELRVAQASGSYNKFIASLAKLNLLILDDWGLGTLAKPERHDLLEMLEDRYALKSTIVTSQLPIKNWHEYIGDATIADAILDRLLNNAYKIEILGPSMRGKNNI